MKATDLRIGNYIQYIPIKNPVKVIAVDSRYNSIVHDNSIALIDGQYEPVPYNEKWCLKFGLKENNQSSHFQKRYNLPDDRFVIYLEEEYGEHKVVFEGNDLTFFRYVHEIQNLCFAVTGDELTEKNLMDAK